MEGIPDQDMKDHERQKGGKIEILKIYFCHQISKTITVGVLILDSSENWAKLVCFLNEMLPSHWSDHLPSGQL